MSDEASKPQLLSCSRCDGPVNQDDLVEGVAVRVDGQTVCPVCIETLSPAIRVQINRVRALKGLAITTYRLRLPQRPGQAIFTFTSAGLVLLHRRALIHGTEFPTPDLPAEGAPKTTIENRATRTGVAPTGEKKRLIGALAGAAIMVIGGLVALLQTGLKTHPTPAGQPSHAPATTSVASSRPALVDQSSQPQAPVTAAPIATPHPLTEPVLATGSVETPPAIPSHSFNEYLTRHANALLALQAAEADQAQSVVIGRLLAQVLSDRKGQLQNALQWLRANQLEKAAALLDAMPLPVDREEFAEQVDSERALRVQLGQRRNLQAQAQTETQAQAQAQLSEPSSTVTTFAPAPTDKPAPKSPTEPKPSEIDTQLWTGPVGPSPAAFVDVDGNRKIPSPWPFFRSLASPRFAAAIKSRGPDRKERYALQLQFPTAVIAGGGVTLCVHPYAPTRKEIAISLLESPERPEQRESLDSAWKVIQIQAPAIASPTITIQLSDVNATPSEPFWLGAVASSSGGLPSATALGMQTPGLLVEDPIIAYKPLLSLLKATAAMRGEPRKWSDPKVVPLAGGIKILSNNDKHKQLVYASIKDRLGMPKIYDNLMETVDVTTVGEIDKLFVKGANPGLEANRPLVALMPQGAEAGLHPDEWSRRVLEISSHLVEGPNDKVKGGWIPVWVIGRLDGKTIDTAVWSKVRNQSSLLVIDLTSNPQPTRGEELQACAQLAESLRTLTYQLQLVQIQQAGK